VNKVYVGEFEVLFSGMVAVPANENVVKICLSDLTFLFEFKSDKKAKDRIETEVGDASLTFKLYNYDELSGQGVVGDGFAHVATLNNRRVGVAFMCYTNVNSSRMFHYTFAYLESER
jgi:hypothetical protein